MSEKFDYFISEKEFPKKDVKKILIDNNINGEILDIKYRPLRKIFSALGYFIFGAYAE